MSRLKPCHLALTVIAAILASLLSAPGLRADSTGSAQDVAERYLAAYSRLDFEDMRALYAPNATFIDPTSFAVLAPEQRIDWQGADAIIDGISNWGLTALDYRIQRTYEASGQVVFDAVVDVTYGPGSGNRTFRYGIVTIIQIENGQVIEHRDYTDFTGAIEISTHQD